MKEILVNSSKPYPIYVLDEKEQFKILPKFIKGEKVAIISDKNIAKLYSAFFDNFLNDKKLYCFVVKSGEKSKSQKTAFKILNYLAKNEFTKNDTLIAFGGGVIGDLVGFVASVYLRGVSYINIPTTLLSMIDSSIGGKTAINLKYGKNLCGSFYSPTAVFSYIGFLDTLSKQDMNCGMGEIIKYTYLNKDIKFTNNVDKDLIVSCIEYKKSIVEQDEFDEGKRKLLNFGHTFGHAIERLSRFKLSHGESIFLGIYYSLLISKCIYKTNDEQLNQYKKYCDYLGLKLPFTFNNKKILKNIVYDKKRSSDFIDFILIDNNGNAKIKKLTFSEISGIIK